jgi:Tol biopolymer transport system component
VSARRVTWAPFARRLAGVLVVFACVGFAVPQAGSSQGATPALVVQQGRLLYAIAVDGSRRVRIAHVPERSNAAVSPDGTKVAFVRKAGGIATMRLDGSERRVLTSVGGDPTWTSDGESIYFVGYHSTPFGAYCGSIFSVPATGGRARRVTDARPTDHSHLDPAVSPDGSRIAFSDWNACEGGTASPRLRVVDVDGRPTRDLARLPRNGYHPNPEHSSPTWSPAGTQIAYRWSSDLAVANRDGTGERRIIRTRGASLIYEPPAWSPDGRWIAFVRYAGPFVRSTRPWVVLVVHPDGTGLRRIARSATDYALAGWLPQMPG